MSADNWTKCPRCVVRKVQRDKDMAEKVKDAYGSVPLEEWLSLRDLTQRDIDTPTSETFREDWEIGVFDGEFFVQYKGVCGECNLRYEFTTQHVLDVGDES